MFMKNKIALLLGTFFVSVHGYHITLSQNTHIADFDALKQMIITSPETIVTTTHDLSHEGREIKSPTAFNTWLITAEQQCPIALMSECTSTSCGLSRVWGQGHKRAQFDDYASTRLVATKNSLGFVNYVSLASGGCFNDLRILTLAHEKGLKQVAVHLIDPTYGSCIRALKNLNTHDIMALVQTKNSYRAQSIREFIRYMHQLFGPENVQLYFYASGQDYLDTIKIIGVYAPDMLIGIDFDPSKKIYNACIHDFIKITEKTSTQALHLTGAGMFHLIDKNKTASIQLPKDSQSNRFSSKLKSYYLKF
jgi:hypothetical protein